MTSALKIALAQVNPTVGDVAGNVGRIKAARAEAAKAGADLVVLSELVVSGYPPEDLVYRQSFLDLIEKAVQELTADTNDGGPGLIVGAPWRDKGKTYNAALLLDGGKIAGLRFKHHLPNYGVFDERRVFEAGPAPGPMVFRGVRLGVMVCEDMWFEDVAETLAESGAEILIVPNGSPFELDKTGVRITHAVARVTDSGLPLIYVNQVCGQDDLVFDGGSFVVNRDRSLAVQMPWWQSKVLVTQWQRAKDAKGDTWVCTSQPPTPPPGQLADVYQAMVLGLRDYVNKNRFPGVVLGLSGGIDSALCAAIAADALGPEKVHCVMMPSPYTSQESLDDAAAVAKFLNVRLDNINIGPAMEAYGKMLGPLFAGTNADITEENLQSRARGVTLMAISNKFGKMVLSTGNKSEMSTGYATLYGDMCGGYAVLKDVYKTTVFAVSRWRNENKPAGALGPAGPVMPDNVIIKPPTAELKPNQKDQDTLPPYDVLDGILRGLIEDQQGIAAVAAKGFDPAVVRRVYRMLKNAEYKRRQAPPGVKMNHIAFGRDYRYPITNGFNDDGSGA